MTAPDPLDVLLVGTGAISDSHADALAGIDGVRLAGAVDVDPGRLAAFAGRHGVPATFTDLGAALDAVSPQVVTLCTPPGLHLAQAAACLARGIHVLCEKPPVLSLAELDELAGLAAAGGAHFATVSQHRFGAGARRLAGLVGDGGLGPVRLVRCDTLWYRPDAYFEVPWRGRWELEGGGTTMGHGIHQMDTVLSVLGGWDEVVAVADRMARPTATEDVSAALVRMSCGALVSATSSVLSPRQTSYLRFDTDAATVELEHLYGYTDDDWRVTPAPGHEDRVAKLWAGGEHGYGSGHDAQWREVVRALRAGEEPPVTLAQVRRTLELVAAVYASAFTGRPVRAGEIGPDGPLAAFHRRMSGTGAPWEAPGA